jgi:predicted ATPase/DNA-binding SARP family transcriptional activator
MAAKLELRLLGPPEASLDGLPLAESLPGKARAVLYYLAVTDQPQTRSTLAGLLWGDLPETAARANLRKVLTQLRRSVGDHLDIDRYKVAFKADCDCWIDVSAFENSVGDASTAVDLKQLQHAVKLYRDDFLTGFSVLHAPDFETWLLAEQARLRELVVQALHTLAASYTELDDLPQGIAYARRLLTLEPWREEAHRQLMLLLARDGQRSAALAKYDLCRQVLTEELGVEPTAETTTLYEQLRTGTLSSGAERKARQEIFSPVPHNLPVPLTPLIGRETELNELAILLADPDLRLLTIVGSGGMGKTRLALAAAQAQTDNFSDGVYFVSLAPLESVDPIVPTVAEALNFSLHHGSAPQQQLLDYLRQKQMLLVLDNFEQLLAGAALVVELLRAAPNLRILITSRIKLDIQGEQLFPIAGIEFPQETEMLEKAAQFSAVRLFLQSAQRVLPDFELTSDNVVPIIWICRLVQGMPLGILLAAAWVDLLDPVEIGAEIERSLDFLKMELRDLPERQQSLRAVFDHSWRLLTKKEQRVFRELSVFRGGFNRQTARAVTGASLPELKALINKSLLSRAASGRYELHELLRQYGAEKLAEDSAQEAVVRDRHSAYYCAALQSREKDLKGPRLQQALAEIEADSENVRAAWRWAVAQGQVKWLEQALEALCLSYRRRQGRYEEAETACRIAAEKLQDTNSMAGQRLLIRVWAWQGNFNRELARPEQAVQLFQQALTLLDSPQFAHQDVRFERAAVLWRMGLLVLRTDYERARHLFEQCLALYQALDDRWWVGRTLGVLSRVAWEVGRYREAYQLNQDCLALFRRLGDREELAYRFAVSGWIALSLGQLEEAEQNQRESLARFRTLSSPEPIANALKNLAAVYFFLGQFAKAGTLLEESVTHYNKLGGGGGIVHATVLLGAAKAQLGQYDQARTQEQAALSLGQEFGDRAGVGHALLWLGHIALVEEAYDEARQLLQESSAIFRELKQQEQVANAVISLGYATHESGETATAQQHLATGLQTAAEIDAFLPLLLAIPLAALLSADQGNGEKAVELYALSSRFPFVSTSRWFEDIVGRRVAAVATTLPPEAVAAARERGQARDIWETAAELLDEREADGFF